MSRVVWKLKVPVASLAINLTLRGSSYKITRLLVKHWYYAPLVAGFIVLLGLGNPVYERPFFHNEPLFSIATLAFLLYLVPAQAYDLGQLRQRPDNRLGIYEVVGEWLRDHTPSDASVGTLEVGMIGYYSQRRMIDFAGLIQPEVSNQLTTHTTYEDAALWAVEHYHPDYLVLHENNFPRLEQEYVVHHCDVIQHFIGKAYGYSMDLNVYACK